MKKLTSLLVLSLLILSSCGKVEETMIIKAEKKPFLIETKIIGKKTETYTVEKTSRLTA